MMPSAKNPNDVVHPGPGRLSAGVVPPAALLYGGGGGGGGAALAAHIADPTDAHMASAIGINPVFAPTGQDLLWSVGGVIDGESVLDFINAAKDLWPDMPDRPGWEAAGSPNTGRPDWKELMEAGVGSGTAVTGAFERGGATIPTHFIVPATSGAITNPSGMVFPADRGVLALYHSPNGDPADPATNLVSALWLGPDPAPGGMAGASFLDTSRLGQQLDYTAGGGGTDHFNLTNRVPYLKEYASPPLPWNPYSANFYRYQIAQYEYDGAIPLGGDDGSWLLVHWKETYATSMAAIQGSQLAANLLPANCYSATQSPDFDTDPCYRVTRRNVLWDGSSWVVPFGVSSATALIGVPSTAFLSGVAFYDNTVALQVSYTVQVGNLYAASFYTGTVAGPNVPAGFESPYDPVTLDLSDFGLSDIGYAYDQMHKAGAFPLYSLANPPLIPDQGQLDVPLLSLSGGTPNTPDNGYGTVRAILRKPFQTGSYADITAYLFNTWPQSGPTTGSTDTYEPFTDEQYRYISTYAGTDPVPPMLPAGPDDFDSTTVFVANGPDLQVIGDKLVYPKVDYSALIFSPTGPNYAAVYVGDGFNHVRRHVRVFDTGIARNTGKLRIRGISLTDMQAAAAFDGNEITGHAAGAIVQVKIPNVTGWLDLGRALGDPALVTTDFAGCLVAVTGGGTDYTYEFNTTAFTVNNGSGKFPLLVRVVLIKNGLGENLGISDIEWLA